jgi:hypothetical protein
MKRGQFISLILGIFFIALGIFGFIPALLHPINAIASLDGVDIQLGYLFGLFPINPPLNFVYLITGILGLVGAIGLGGSRIYGRSLFFFFAILALFGSLPGFNTTFGFMPIFGNDVWLHAIVAVIGFYLGFIDSPGLLEIASQAPEDTVPYNAKLQH